MDYNQFKGEMINSFVFKDCDTDMFDEQDLNDFYTIFKGMWFDTVEKWCDFYFKDWSLDTHGVELKSKISES